MKKILPLARQQSQQAEAADLLAAIVWQPWYFIGIRYAPWRALVLSAAGHRKVSLAETFDFPMKLILMSIIIKYQKFIADVAPSLLRSAACRKTSNTSSSSTVVSTPGHTSRHSHSILETNTLSALR